MQSKECSICFSEEIIKPAGGLHTNCFSCVNCITEWTITKIKEAKANFDDKIPCHMISCSKKIQIRSIHEMLPINCQKKINEALFQVYLVNEKDIRKCPNPNCSYAGIIGKLNCKFPFECPLCGAQWKDCQQPVTLKNVFNKINFYKDDCFSNIRKFFFTKKCPSCKNRIEKDGGCEHMNYSRCGFNFCRLCNAPYPSHNNINILMKTILGNTICYQFTIV